MSTAFNNFWTGIESYRQAQRQRPGQKEEQKEISPPLESDRERRRSQSKAHIKSRFSCIGVDNVDRFENTRLVPGPSLGASGFESSWSILLFLGHMGCREAKVWLEPVFGSPSTGEVIRILRRLECKVDKLSLSVFRENATFIGKMAVE